MERLRAYFGYKNLSEANLYSKDSGKNAKDDDNAFVREMVSRATSDILMSSDWALNMEVVDFLNRSDKKIKQAVACSLAKRLSYQDSHVRDLTLTLTDTCVKNCGQEFHKFLSDVHFGKTLADIVVRSDTKGCAVEVRDKALGLLQEWKDAMGEEASDFADAFSTLKFKHNVSFPRPKRDCVPVNTPPARYATKESKEEEANQAAIAEILRAENQALQQAQGNSNQSYRIVTSEQPRPVPEQQLNQAPVVNVNYRTYVREAEALSSLQVPRADDSYTIGKSIDEEMNSISSSCGLLKEMLQAVDNSNSKQIEVALADDLIQGLVHQCKLGQEELRKWISSISDERIMHQALSLNDEIDLCLMLHESLKDATSAAKVEIKEEEVYVGGHDLYKNMFSPQSAEASSSSHVGASINAGSSSSGGEGSAVTLPLSDMGGAVELKDIVLGNAGSGLNKSENRGKEPDFVDLIDFGTSDAAEPATSKDSDCSSPDTIQVSSQEKGGDSEPVKSNEASAGESQQASRMEDLLSL